jgi:hypothetical protein
MTVDFELKRVPGRSVACIAWYGKWNEKVLKSKFAEIERWARGRRAKTGQYFFYERQAGRLGKEVWHFEACVEVRLRGRGSEGVRLRSLPAARVAAIAFDPEELSPRIVYHALSDWTRTHRKDKGFGAVGATREVYPGNPWTNAKAWSRAEVQFLLRG